MSLHSGVQAAPAPGSPEPAEEASAGGPSAAPAAGWRGGWAQGLSYGGLGLPLAFVALPLYVVLPNHYASAFGVPLATLGALLLGARLLDAFADPLIGRWVDRWFAASAVRVLVAATVAAVVLALGFRGLFFPAVEPTGTALLVWCAAALAVTYLAFSVLSVLHQAWGARLGGDEVQRARIVAWREGLSLVGVLVASVLPSVAGLGPSTAVFAVLLALCVAALWRAPQPLVSEGLSATQADHPASAATAHPAQPQQDDASSGALLAPLQRSEFRRLLGIYLLNGIASAVPATLVLFFIRDRLQAPAWEPLFLATYFAAGALSIPLWTRGVARFGLARCWLGGMLLAVASFVWAAALGSGDVAAYAAVCAASGIALGADLALPGALLAGVIQRAGDSGRLEGAYFGWWNFATKLNLALAAGASLPLLAAFGYSPGARDASGLQALTLAYCALPCALKLGAAGLLHSSWIARGLR